MEEKHLKSSAFLTDIVIGLSDGLTVPFALAAGLSGAVDSTTIVLTAGIAEIAAGSIAMGLGGYLAGQTEVEHYNAELLNEYEEVERIPEKEKEEVREILAEYGISEATQHLVVDELALHKDKWVEFMMKFELGLEKPDLDRAKKSAFNIGVSYIVGGFIPLSPYFFVVKVADGLFYSCAVTLAALLIFGYFKSKMTGQNPVIGALKVAAIGSVAAGAAFYIARLFN